MKFGLRKPLTLMERSKKALIVSIMVAIVAAATALAEFDPQRMQMQTPDALPTPRKEFVRRQRQLPIVDFDSKASADEKVRSKQEARASRYDRHSSQPIQEGYLISGRIWSTHWFQGISALPFDQSEVVLIGGVLEANAHLSNDKTGIYSEFAVQVKEVLKNSTKESIDAGSLVSIERFGGAVRFPSGVIQKYETTGQGMPRPGEQYLFFLKRLDTEEFSLVTGYQLDGEIVRPLDGSIVEEGKGSYPFDIYQGIDVSSFLRIVKSQAAQKLG
jgi:hypothetical protein